MPTVDDFNLVFEPLRSGIEAQYPLRLGRVRYRPLEGDDGWRVDFQIEADLLGKMSLLDLCGLEEAIRERTGFAVVVDTRPAAERTRAAPRVAAE